MVVKPGLVNKLSTIQNNKEYKSMSLFDWSGCYPSWDCRSHFSTA